MVGLVSASCGSGGCGGLGGAGVGYGWSHDLRV